MATHVVREGSMYRTGVVLKTATNLYFYRTYLQTEESTFCNTA